MIKSIVSFLILIIVGIVVFNTDVILNIKNHVYVSPEVIFYEIAIVGSLIYYEACKKKDNNKEY